MADLLGHNGVSCASEAYCFTVKLDASPTYRRLAVREKPANPIAVALRHETIDVRRKCSIRVDFGRHRGVVRGDRSAHSHRDDLLVRAYHQVLAEPSFGGEAVQRARREHTVVRKMIEPATGERPNTRSWSVVPPRRR